MDAKISAINSEINQTVDIMRQNIETVINRGEKLEDIELKTNEIMLESIEFEQSSKKVKEAMCWKKYRLYLIIAGAAFLLALLIIIAIVFGTK